MGARGMLYAALVTGVPQQFSCDCVRELLNSENEIAVVPGSWVASFKTPEARTQAQKKLPKQYKMEVGTADLKSVFETLQGAGALSGAIKKGKSQAVIFDLPKGTDKETLKKFLQSGNRNNQAVEGVEMLSKAPEKEVGGPCALVTFSSPQELQLSKFARSCKLF